ncbi:hypothetical protein PV783_19675 [Chitinophaga sp. CC14]|uniref:alpha-galactosidase n=1 Tax=Chitinophaga sp. CC14 TaxID=3029199 RepID=UPI003B7A1684
MPALYIDIDINKVGLIIYGNDGRKIVLSTSPGETPIDHAAHVQQYANMWRTVGDFWDNWKQLKEHFQVFERWNKRRAPGAYPDGDMLPLGRIGIRAERGHPCMSGFTKDEQYTLITLWSIFKSPLMFGGNLPDNDPFTLSLLTNKNVLKVLNTSTGNRPLFTEDDKAAWMAEDPATGAKYLAVFNTADQPSTPNATIPIDLGTLGITGSCKIIDLWSGKPAGSFSGTFSPVIASHGAGLYKIEEKRK